MISRDRNIEHLRYLKARLDAHGIPSVIQGENTARMITSFVLFEPTLWIYVDAQYEDAIQVIENPDYVPKSSIDLDEFHGTEYTAAEQGSELNATLLNLGVFMAVIMGAMFLFIKVLEWLRG